MFVPMYGAPYVRDMDGNRRYSTQGRPLRFPPARLHVAGAALHLVDHLRADGRAGAQAPPAHHVRLPQVVRQAVHGHRHREGAGGRHHEDGRHRVRRRLRQEQHGARVGHQLQFAAGVGSHHAGGGADLRLAQPAAADLAVRVVRRLDVGLDHRRGRPGQRRDAGRPRLHPAGSARQPADLRPVHGGGRHEVRRADGRHPGGGADDAADRPAGPEVQGAVPHLRLPRRLEDGRTPRPATKPTC